MAYTATLYGNFPKALLNKEIDFDSDSIKGRLLASGYTPDKDTHDYANDLTNELSTANGYTAGGLALTNVALSYIAANSWATARANSTAYATGQIVRPASGNGYLYMASTGGTSAGSIPTYPTNIGGTVTDGSVVWTCVGRGYVKITADSLVWNATAGNTITARYCALLDGTPGTEATRPLIGYVDFGADLGATGAAFTVNWDSVAGMAGFIVA